MTRTRVVMLAVVAFLLVEMAASMVWPRTVPRLGLLPKPPDREWHDGCNRRALGWERTGPIWGATHGQTLIACP